MTPVRLTLTAAALSLSLFATACQNEDHSSATHGKQSQANLPPPKQMNQMSAQEKLNEAEQAEKDGKYAHALECYEQLRSYPEASRPKDLDDRVKRIEARMKSPQ